ncbi:MAG: type VI secretion system tip protein VgrG [Chthoniobacterales bacterium]|nr:type VI secretion system tip protein VgrG [Chthoniobacterales bacterium]
MKKDFSQANRPIQLLTPLGDDFLLLQKIHLREWVGQPFDLRIVARSSNFEIRPEVILGQKVTVVLHLPKNKVRYINGVVSDFVRTTESSEVIATYVLRVVPSLALMEFGSDCAIYQQMTAPQILSEILKKNSISDISFHLLKNYNLRGICVQYRETFFNFFLRLCEDEGIFYFFKHSKDSHTLVVADDNSAFGKFDGCEHLTFRRVNNYKTDFDILLTLEETTKLHTGRVSLKDYDYMAPKKNLTASSSSNLNYSSSSHEIFEFPGGFEAPFDYQHYAKIRQEAICSEAHGFLGRAHSWGICAGAKISFHNLPRGFPTQNFIVLSTNLVAENPDYQTNQLPNSETGICKFYAIPETLPYRLSRRAYRPRIYGVQTAIVTGPESQNSSIPYVSPLGSIKVQFHWDRYGSKNDKSSGWVRVAQFFAGSGYGAIFCPRIGNEVVVVFEEGDPDRPLVIGSVYNAENLPILSLPENAQRCYICDDGGNAMCFNPMKGSESLVMYSPHQEHMHVLGASNAPGYQKPFASILKK